VVNALANAETIADGGDFGSSITDGNGGGDTTEGDAKVNKALVGAEGVTEVIGRIPLGGCVF